MLFRFILCHYTIFFMNSTLWGALFLWPPSCKALYITDFISSDFIQFIFCIFCLFYFIFFISFHCIRFIFFILFYLILLHFFVLLIILFFIELTPLFSYWTYTFTFIDWYKGKWMAWGKLEEKNQQEGIRDLI